MQRNEKAGAPCRIPNILGATKDLLNLAGLGKLRTDGRADFIKTMNSLQMQPDKVYTFSFWCISRFVDVLDWNLLGIVPGGIDFNVFCGRPPVNIVIYELDDAEEAGETRHLQSRKKYFCNMSLWSRTYKYVIIVQHTTL